MSGGNDYDVAVLGGGPAGIACACTLAKRGNRVVVFERSGYEGPRFGETLGPEIQPLLNEFGAWERFAATPRIPFRTVVSSWGAPGLTERSSITHPLGEGWHVDRAGVDRALACVASESGIPVQMSTGFCSLARTKSGWEITPANGAAATAHFLVDASGRGAPATASALPERQWIRDDRMIAASVRCQAPGGGATPVAGELLLESAAAGWWYSVPQPDGPLLVIWMTDADLLGAGGRDAWRSALAQTVYTSARAGSGDCEPLRTVRADSGMSSPDSGRNWLLTGDAAMACDPLSGSGFARALRSGIEAAGYVEQSLLSGEPASTQTSVRFASYRQRKAHYYSLETRWKASPFWARRRT